MAAPERILSAQVPWARLNPSEFTHVPCNVCGCWHDEVLAGLVVNWSEFLLVRCRRCGLIWRNPLPGRTFNETLYDENYFRVDAYGPDIRHQVGIPDHGEDEREFRDRISRKEVETWIKFGFKPKDESGKPRRLLEIGGGRGYLQQAAREFGWDTIGLEISPHGIKSAITKGQVVLPVTLDELCLRYVPYESYFDLIIFYDFLEHVDDPGRVLRMVRFVLSQDGTIIFRVPNTVGRPSLHLIDHVWHFSLKSLSLLLAKEGFRIVRAHHSGTYDAPGKGTIQNITVLAAKSDAPQATEPKEVELEPNPLAAWLEAQSNGATVTTSS